MSRAKNKKGNSPSRKNVAPPSGGLLRWIFGSGRPVVLLLAITGLFGGASYLAWQHVRKRVLSSESYWLPLENVEITPLPEWIHTDIRIQVFRDASLDRPLSITDDDLVQRIRDGFALHPWVAKVQRVQKFHPARVRVDVVYRRPVCMVESAGELIPVDEEGLVLPGEDFSPVEKSRYPRLVGIESAPLGPVGTRWGDDSVLGGAEIAASLSAGWEKWGLGRIVPARPAGAGLRDTATFELRTRNETRILWGRAPAGDASGQVPAKEKVARLEKYFAEHGTLDGKPASVLLDLSRPPAGQGAASDGPLIPLPHRKGT